MQSRAGDYRDSILATKLLTCLLVLITTPALTLGHTPDDIIAPELRAWISPEDSCYFALFHDGNIPQNGAPGQKGWLYETGESLTVQCLYDFVWFPRVPFMEDPFYRGTLEVSFEAEVKGVNASPAKTSPTWAWACSTSLRIKAPPARHFHDPLETGCNAIACFVVDFPCTLTTPNVTGPQWLWTPDTLRTIVTMRYQNESLDTTFVDTRDHYFYVKAGNPTAEPHDCNIHPDSVCISKPFAEGRGGLIPGAKLADPGNPVVNSQLLEAAKNSDLEVGQPRILVASQEKGWVDLFSRGDQTVPDNDPFNNTESVHYYAIGDIVYMKSGFDIYVLWQDSSAVHVEMKIDIDSSGTWIPYDSLHQVLTESDATSQGDSLPKYVIWPNLRIQLPSDSLVSQDYRCMVRDTI